MSPSSWINARFSAALDAVMGHFALVGTLFVLHWPDAWRGLIVLICSAAVILRPPVASLAPRGPG